MMKRTRWLLASLAMGGLTFLLSWLPSSGADAPADPELQRFRDKLESTGPEREKLRQDVHAYWRRHAGTPQALAAANLLAQLPSPLDKLDPKAIPPLERLAGQPKNLVAVVGEHAGRQGAGVTGVAISPDGKTVASVGGHYVRLWDRGTMKPILPTLGHTNAYAVAFSPDGKMLAVAGVASVGVWDLTGDKPQSKGTMPASSAHLYALAFSPNSKMLVAGGSDVILYRWDVSQAKVAVLPGLSSGHAKAIQGVTFSRDGKYLATGSEDATIKLWEVNGNQLQEKASLEGVEKGVTALLFYDHRHLIAGTRDGVVRQWDCGLPRPAAQKPFKAHEGAIHSFSLSRDGRTLATGSADYTAKVWDFAYRKPKEKAVCKGHDNIVYSVALAPDGRSVVTGSYDWTARWWNLGPKPVERTVTRGHLSANYAVDFSPDGKTLAAGGYDYWLRLWDLGGKDPRPVTTLKGKQPFHVYAAGFGLDGKRLVACGNSQTLQLWEVDRRRELPPLAGHEGPVYALSVSGDGRKALSGGYDKKPRLWNLAEGAPITSWEAHDSPIACVALSLDGKRALTGSGRYVVNEKGMPVLKDGMYVYTDCVVRLWDVDAGKPLHTFKEHKFPLYCVGLAPDGKRAVSGASSEASLHRWDLAEGKYAAAGGYFGKSAHVAKAVYSPDGRLLATYGPDYLVIVWDAVSGVRLFEWQPAEYIGGLAFAPDSRHLAIGLYTGVVYVVRL